MPSPDPQFKTLLKSDQLSRIGPAEPPTEEKIDAARRMCATNAADAQELTMFLNMLGIAP
jgi:hypothetical protein